MLREHDDSPPLYSRFSHLEVRTSRIRPIFWDMVQRVASLAIFIISTAALRKTFISSLFGSYKVGCFSASQALRVPLLWVIHAHVASGWLYNTPIFLALRQQELSTYNVVRPVQRALGCSNSCRRGRCPSSVSPGPVLDLETSSPISAWSSASPSYWKSNRYAKVQIRAHLE